MPRTFLQPKIDGAPVTRSILEWEGSVTGDEHLSEARTSNPTVALVDSQNRIVARNAVEVPRPARRVRA